MNSDSFDTTDGTRVMKASDYITLPLREQIYLEPDVQFGSMEFESIERCYITVEMMEVLKAKKSSTATVSTTPAYLIKDKLELIPGFNKISDEPMMNQSDHCRRQSGLTVVKNDADPTTGVLSFWNNGNAPPCIINEKGEWIPQAPWFEFNSSSNFHQNIAYIAGKNGYGVKLSSLAAVWSELEIKDHRNNVHYKQRSENNLSVIHAPVVKPIYKTKEAHEKAIEEFQIPTTNKRKGAGSIGARDFVHFRFMPDYAWFKMTGLDSNHLRWLMSRTVDMAAQLVNVKVYFNGHLLSSLFCKNFKEYVALPNALVQPGEKTKFVIHTFNAQWTIAVKESVDAKFHHTSFVNAIDTRRGGKHVDYICNQLISRARELLVEKIYKSDELTKLEEKERKKLLERIYNKIKKHMHLFIQALILKPKFDSQSKEYLTTTTGQFGSECVISDEFVWKVIKLLSLDERITNWKKESEFTMLNSQLVMTQTENKEMKQTLIEAFSDTTATVATTSVDIQTLKKTRLSGIAKLDDAVLAGGKFGKDCTIIFCEGDSAKALVVAGLSVIGTQYFGVFPLRGKLLNVRGASMKQIEENVEIMAILAIIGLQFNVHYETEEKRNRLRYGAIMLMMDGDYDGSHIKGLFFNLIAEFWPELLQVPHFMSVFVTAIVIATRGPITESFNTEQEFANWLEANDEAKGWNIRYYKGLGTSTAAMAKSYFQNIDRHRIYFQCVDERCAKALEMAFGKDKRAFVESYQPGTFLDQSAGKVISYLDFVGKELSKFAEESNRRAFINIIDGQKDCSRKILYIVFSKRVFSDLKVAQLANKVAENTCYHHGEASLAKTIVNMAQNFVGACNNMELLFPNGMFGSRAQGGADAANGRYIFTYAHLVTRATFPESHQAILQYKHEEGMDVEPNYLIPIYPVCLANGSEGIGTAYRSKIPSYSVRALVNNIRCLLRNEALAILDPHYNNFTGTIVWIDSTAIQQAYNENYPIKFNTDEFRRYYVFGRIEEISATELWITELPIGYWTQYYNEFLQSLIEEGKIDAFLSMHGDDTVKFVVYVNAMQRSAIETSFYETREMKHKEVYVSEESPTSNLYWFFKLYDQITTNEMIAYDAQERMKHYKNVEEIQMEFYQFRFQKYEELIQLLIAEQENVVHRVETVIQYLNDIIQGRVLPQSLSREETLNYFRTHRKEYRYEEHWSQLFSLTLGDLNTDQYNKRCLKLKQEEQELASLKAQTVQAMWQGDLDNFERELTTYEAEKQRLRTSVQLGPQPPQKGKKKANKKQKLSLATTPIIMNQTLIPTPSINWMLRRYFPRKKVIVKQNKE